MKSTASYNKSLLLMPVRSKASLRQESERLESAPVSSRRDYPSNTHSENRLKPEQKFV
jgi:hypothetical protein